MLAFYGIPEDSAAFSNHATLTPLGAFPVACSFHCDSPSQSLSRKQERRREGAGVVFGPDSRTLFLSRERCRSELTATSDERYTTVLY